MTDWPLWKVFLVDHLWWTFVNGFCVSLTLPAVLLVLGTISGTVTDSTGAVVHNAKVVITDLVTNATRETKTNAQGEYRVFGLAESRYQVAVSMAGMRTTQITGIVLHGTEV